MVRRKKLRNLNPLGYRQNQNMIGGKSYRIDVRRRQEINSVINIGDQNTVNSIAVLIDQQFLSTDLAENKIELRRALTCMSNKDFETDVWNECKSNGIINNTERHYE